MQYNQLILFEMYIILNEEQKNSVDGTTCQCNECQEGYSCAKLKPIMLANGTEWILPDSVLKDERFEYLHAQLNTYPQRDTDIILPAQPEEEENNYTE